MARANTGVKHQETVDNGFSSKAVQPRPLTGHKGEDSCSLWFWFHGGAQWEFEDFISHTFQCSQGCVLPVRNRFFAAEWITKDGDGRWAFWKRRSWPYYPSVPCVEHGRKAKSGSCCIDLWYQGSTRSLLILYRPGAHRLIFCGWPQFGKCCQMLQSQKKRCQTLSSTTFGAWNGALLYTNVFKQPLSTVHERLWYWGYGSFGKNT